jgi:hypothetical protein
MVLGRLMRGGGRETGAWLGGAHPVPCSFALGEHEMRVLWIHKAHVLLAISSAARHGHVQRVWTKVLDDRCRTLNLFDLRRSSTTGRS